MRCADIIYLNSFRGEDHVADTREYKTTQARRDANKRWDEAHELQTISCRVYKSDAEDYKKYVQTLGNDAKPLTPSKHLAKYIQSCAEAYRQNHSD